MSTLHLVIDFIAALALSVGSWLTGRNYRRAVKALTEANERVLLAQADAGRLRHSTVLAMLADQLQKRASRAQTGIEADTLRSVSTECIKLAAHLALHVKGEFVHLPDVPPPPGAN